MSILFETQKESDTYTSTDFQAGTGWAGTQVTELSSAASQDEHIHKVAFRTGGKTQTHAL